MAETNVLSEIKPDAGVDFTLYSPEVGATASGTIFCLNQGSNQDRVSVGLIQAGNPTDPTVWIAYRSILDTGHSIYLQQIHLGPEDIILVNSQLGTSNFIFSGTKIS